MSEAVHVRRAQAGDFAGVTELLTEMGRPAVAPERREEVQRVFERHVARDDVGSLVASPPGSPARIVGFCSLEFRERLNWPSREAWVPDLVVTATMRRRGVARALLAAAFRAAEERGCHRLTLESGYHRKEAHELYRSVGMEDLGKFFAKPFP